MISDLFVSLAMIIALLLLVQMLLR